MIVNSVQNGPLVWPTIVQEDDTTMTKKYKELSVTEKLQADCDLKATNIVLQGLLPDVYAIFNHLKVAKEICDRGKLLMQGTKLSLQEKECKLYDEFDKFSYVKGETLYQYYLRFSQLINNINIINMSMRPVQVNTKFLNSLPPEWSKFLTDVKLARDLHTTNNDHLYSYLEQHEAHANETHLMLERYQDPLAFVSNFNKPPSYITNYHSPYSTKQFPQQTNIMIQQVYSPQSYSPMNAAPQLSQLQVNHSSIPPSLQYQTQVLLFMCLLKEMILLHVSTRQWRSGEGHMARKCTQFKRLSNDAWFKDKEMLVEAQKSNQILDEEQLAFLTDLGILDCQAAQKTTPNNVAFQSKDLDAYDSDCDDVSNAKAILMANLSNYGSDVILEVPHYEPYDNDMDNQSIVISSQHVVIPVIDDEETLISKELNQLSKDFGKRFVSQQELSTVEAFWLQTSHPNTDQSDISPIKIEAPRELPKLSLDKSCDDQNALKITEYFETNNLKAQLQAKDTTIRKLNEHIKSIRANDKEEKVKQDMDEIETINIELEHSVANLVFENELLRKEIEHLKKIYKDQFELIKKTRQIQEKVFVTTSLQNELRRLKGKNVLDNATTITNAITIAPGMFKLDLDPLALSLSSFRQELLEYMGVHDNDASKSSKPSWGKMYTSGT
nr:hypothetical protein [Tanacetum cinerariifolium]